MSRWKSLPETLEDRERQLVVQLRRLKDHSGLSLAALAAKTSYSRSSWERYLNGKLPVPREAVEELARVCGTEPTRLLVLHEVAERTRGRGGEGAGEGADLSGELSGPVLDLGPEPPGAGPRAAGRTLPLRAVLVVTALALGLGFAAGALAAPAWQDDGKDPGRGVYSYEKGRTYPCEDRREDGGRYAGYSLNRDIQLDRGMSGWDVVEAQCLLKRAGFGSGAVDGAYGDSTKKAALRFQRARHLAEDGIVGHDTWGELRK
ncbi:helix-turn-helix domain-containing protein [Actinomycetota bacterium Odt1-20B]